jgi:hypothetical protein
MMGTSQTKGKDHAHPTSCKAATRREKRGREPRRLRGKWAEEVYDGVPYAHAGRGLSPEVEEWVQHGAGGRAGSVGSHHIGHVRAQCKDV